MIFTQQYETPILLVLGAGASNPYGFPLGDKLKNNISKSVKIMADTNTGWVHESKILIDDLYDFTEKLDTSERPSIDSFLYKYRNYKDFPTIGKMAIVDQIAHYEDYHYLRNPNEDNWYGYLVKNLFDCEVDEIPDKISVISYNYDRSFEEYLIEPLLGTYPELETYTDCAKIIKKIPIVHAYGRLDPLDWEVKGGRKYGDGITPSEIAENSKKIQLIHEAKDKIDKDNVSNIVDDAKKVYFLGMDLYQNRENLEIFDNSLFENKRIIATGFDLTGKKRDNIRNFFEIRGNGINFDISSSKSLETIDTFEPF